MRCLRPRRQWARVVTTSRSPMQLATCCPHRVARGGGAASPGSALPAALAEVTAARGPILSPALVAEPAAEESSPTGDEVVEALLDDPFGSEPAGRETEVAASPGAADGKTVVPVSEAVVSPVTPAIDLPGPITPLECAPAAAGASHALVPYRRLQGSRYPGAPQGVPVGGTSWAAGFAPVSLGPVAAAPEGAGEADVWKDALSDVASTSTMLRVLVDTLDSKVLPAGQVGLLAKP